MKTDTKQKILEYISTHDISTVKEIVQHLGLYATVIHRHLNDLQEEGLIRKLGKAPRVFYRAVKKESYTSDDQLSYIEKQFLDNNYYNYNSDGTLLEGYEGFTMWCEQRTLDIKKQFSMYKSMYMHIESLKNVLGIIPADTNLSGNL